jgi:tol-pal system protein YbgF
MKRFAMGGALLALLSGCATNGDLEATRQQIDQVNQQASTRLNQIETKLSNDKLLDMLSQLEDLKAQVVKQGGQIEVLNHNLQTTQKRQDDLYADLDGRLARLEHPQASSEPLSQTAPSENASQPLAVQAASPFEKSLDALRNRNFAEAVSGLSHFIQANPGDAHVAEASYWLGVAHTGLRQYDAAIEIHRQFVAQYPNNPKAPDALRNIANCQRELDQNDEARATLKRLIRLYPRSAAAAKAKLMLKSL